MSNTATPTTSGATKNATKKLLKLTLLLAASLALLASACGGGNKYEDSAVVLLGSDEDKAQQQVSAAIYRYNQIGTDAFGEISDPEGPFISGEIYAFVVDPTGVTMAHAANPDLVGENLYDLQDSDGHYIVRGIIDRASAGGGWVTYKFTNPVSGNEEPKRTWVVPHDGLIFGSGDYFSQQDPAVVLLGSDADRAQQQVSAAIYRYNQIGSDVYGEISDVNGFFIEDEVYAFVLDYDGLILAHAANPDLVGDFLFDLQDSDGSYVVRGIIDQAREGGGWVAYRFSNPVSGNEEPKNTWVVPHDGLIFGSGDYVSEQEFAALRG